MPVTSFLLLRVDDIKSFPICYKVKVCTLTVPKEQQSCILLCNTVVLFESVILQVFCCFFFFFFFLTSDNLKVVFTFEDVLGGI